MALNRFMHPKNRYKENKPDFATLAEKYPEFAKHVSVNLAGNASLDFHDPESLRALTCTLLKEDFQLDVELPLDRIIPTVPLRLNYIHWIEDLLQQCGYTTNIHGIDIGCGASCIYPLLGCQLNGWYFAASEVDELSLQYACDNVKRNNLQDKIKVLATPSDTLIQGIFKEVPQSLYHFTMCNPPFFGNMLEAQGIMCRTMCRPDPKSVSTASEVEMIYEGGEVDFVKRMIAESLQLREQVLWYTSMVGKKSSLGPLKDELKKCKIRNFTTTEFCQGRTMRWGIAWTFHDDISVLPPSKRRKEKHRPPLVITVPNPYVDKALEITKSKTSSSAPGHKDKIHAIALVTKQMLDKLQMSFTVLPSSRKIIKLECTAYKNTWANQRRKRRQRQRLNQQETGDEATSIQKESGVQEAKTSTDVERSIDPIRSDRTQVPSVSSDINTRQNESRTLETKNQLDSSIQETGTDNSAKTSTDVESTIRPARSKRTQAQSGSLDLKTIQDCESRTLGTKDQLDHKLLPPVGVRRPSTKNAGTADSNANSHVQGGEDGSSICDDRNRSEHSSKDPSTSSEEDKPEHSSHYLAEGQCQAQGDALGGDSVIPPENVEDSQPMLLKCTIVVKMIDENVVVELNWLDGSNRESMHQVGQYMKNQFNK